MAINFKKSISNPIPTDDGNYATQGRRVSKTIKLGSFTTNRNAVWAARNQLRKESFPFARVSIPVNRNMFRLQVGDVFKFSYSKYGISEMICRVMQVEEDDLKSENITIHAIEDIFSVTNVDEDIEPATDNTGEPPEYDTDPFLYETVVEAPYVLSLETSVIPLAARVNTFDSGFWLYMSTDGGSSYNPIESTTNIQPYGTLSGSYGITYAIDDYEGLTIDFVADAASIDTVTWSDILSGSRNTAILGEEIISFKDITPVSGTLYKLENVIRGRYGSQRVAHSPGEDFWFIPRSIGIFNDSNIVKDADLKFKLVPYNINKVGEISAASAIDLSIEGLSSTPYIPINFNANGESFNPLYTSGSDITLTWSPRIRGEGCGVGVPGSVFVDNGHEGLFKVEVYVSAALVRTTTAIDAQTWDYTNAMNVSDNGTPADTITFKLYNYIENSGKTYTTDAVQVICNKE